MSCVLDKRNARFISLLFVFIVVLTISTSFANGVVNGEEFIAKRQNYPVYPLNEDRNSFFLFKNTEGDEITFPIEPTEYEGGKRGETAVKFPYYDRAGNWKTPGKAHDVTYSVSTKLKDIDKCFPQGDWDVWYFNGWINKDFISESRGNRSDLMFCSINTRDYYHSKSDDKEKEEQAHNFLGSLSACRSAKMSITYTWDIDRASCGCAEGVMWLGDESTGLPIENKCCGNIPAEDVGFFNKIGDTLVVCVQNPNGDFEWLAADSKSGFGLGATDDGLNPVIGNIYPVLNNAYYNRPTVVIDGVESESYVPPNGTRYELLSDGKNWHACLAPDEDTVKGNKTFVDQGLASGEIVLHRYGETVTVEWSGASRHDYVCINDGNYGPRFVECRGKSPSFDRNSYAAEPLWRWMSSSISDKSSFNSVFSFEDVPKYLFTDFFVNDKGVKYIDVETDSGDSVEGSGQLAINFENDATFVVPEIFSPQLYYTNWSSRFLEGYVKFEDSSSLQIAFGLDKTPEPKDLTVVSKEECESLLPHWNIDRPSFGLAYFFNENCGKYYDDFDTEKILTVNPANPTKEDCNEELAVVWKSGTKVAGEFYDFFKEYCHDFATGNALYNPDKKRKDGDLSLTQCKNLIPLWQEPLKPTYHFSQLFKTQCIDRFAATKASIKEIADLHRVNLMNRPLPTKETCSAFKWRMTKEEEPSYPFEIFFVTACGAHYGTEYDDYVLTYPEGEEPVDIPTSEPDESAECVICSPECLPECPEGESACVTCEEGCVVDEDECPEVESTDEGEGVPTFDDPDAPKDDDKKETEDDMKYVDFARKEMITDYIVGDLVPNEWLYFAIPMPATGVTVDRLKFILDSNFFNLRNDTEYNFYLDEFSIAESGGIPYCGMERYDGTHPQYKFFTDKDQNEEACQGNFVYVNGTCCGDDRGEFFAEDKGGCWNSEFVASGARFAPVMFRIEAEDSSEAYDMKVTCVDSGEAVTECEYLIPTFKTAKKLKIVNNYPELYNVTFKVSQNYTTSISDDIIVVDVFRYEFMAVDEQFSYCGKSLDVYRENYKEYSNAFDEVFDESDKQRAEGVCSVDSLYYCSDEGWSRDTVAEKRDKLDEPDPEKADGQGFAPTLDEFVHYKYIPSGDWGDLYIAKEAACCPEDYCWNGSICIENESDEPHRPPSFVSDFTNSDGYRCIDGEWKFSNSKYPPYDFERGYCEYESDCFVSLTGNYSANYNLSGNPQCVASGDIIGDRYCENGNWISRTKMLASTMLDNFGSGEVSVFCDTFGEALNDASNVGGRSFSDLVMGSCALNEDSLASDRPCVNNFCVLYSEKGVAYGTSVNINLTAGGTNSIRDTLGIGRVDACDVDRKGLIKCSSDEVNGRKSYWFFDPEHGILINSEYRLGGVSSIFEDILKYLKGWFSSDNTELGFNYDELQESLDINYLKSDTRYDKLYYSNENGRTIVAIGGVLLDLSTGDVVNYVGVEYRRFRFDSSKADVRDICEYADIYNLFNYEDGDYELVCSKYTSSDKPNYIFVASPNVRIWKDLTAKLRLVE